jgi:hypothetical protein
LPVRNIVTPEENTIPLNQRNGLDRLIAGVCNPTAPPAQPADRCTFVVVPDAKVAEQRLMAVPGIDLGAEELGTIAIV